MFPRNPTMIEGHRPRTTVEFSPIEFRRRLFLHFHSSTVAETKETNRSLTNTETVPWSLQCVRLPVAGLLSLYGSPLLQNSGRIGGCMEIDPLPFARVYDCEALKRIPGHEQEPVVPQIQEIQALVLECP